MLIVIILGRILGDLNFYLCVCFFLIFFYAENILVYINDFYEIKMDGSMRQKLIQFPQQSYFPNECLAIFYFFLYHQRWILTIQKTTTSKTVCPCLEYAFIRCKLILGSLSPLASLESGRDFRLVSKICPLFKAVLCVSTSRKTIGDNVFANHFSGHSNFLCLKIALTKNEIKVCPKKRDTPKCRLKNKNKNVFKKFRSLTLQLLVRKSVTNIFLEQSLFKIGFNRHMLTSFCCKIIYPQNIILTLKFFSKHMWFLQQGQKVI